MLIVFNNNIRRRLRIFSLTAFFLFLGWWAGIDIKIAAAQDIGQKQIRKPSVFLQLAGNESLTIFPWC